MLIPLSATARLMHMSLFIQRLPRAGFPDTMIDGDTGFLVDGLSTMFAMCLRRLLRETVTVTEMEMCTVVDTDS